MKDPRKDEYVLYHPLPPGKHMRVLSLDQSKVFGERRYSLTPRRIDPSEPYLALSYRWRTKDGQPSISINGRRKSIMKTVNDFLDLHFRDATCNQIFIDSICINQDDLYERAAQVRLMGEIYSRAAEVCVWLGDDITLTDRYNLHAVTDQWTLVQASHRRRLDLANSLFGKEYWMRAWVIQELLLPRTIVAFWGDTIVLESTLQTVVNFGLGQSWMGILRAMTVMLQRRHMQNSRRPDGLKLPPSLVQLLSDYRYTRATDTRDQVYAFLGMAEESTLGGSMDIDYSAQKSTADVFCDVLSHYTVDPSDIFDFARRLARTMKLQNSNIRVKERASQQYIQARGWQVSRVSGQGSCIDLNTYSNFRHAARKSSLEAYILWGKDFVQYPTWHQHDFLQGRREDAEVSSDDEALREKRMFQIRHDGPRTPGSLPTLGPDHHIIGVREEDRPDPELLLTGASAMVPRVRPTDRRTALGLLYPTTRGSVLSREQLEPSDVICRFKSRRTVALALREVDSFYVPLGCVYLSDGFYGKEGKRWAYPETGATAGAPGAVRFRMNILALCTLAL